MATRKRARPSRKRKATTAEVIGLANDKLHVPVKWKRHFRRLLDLRDHFLHHQLDLAKDAIEEQPSYSTHMADAGTDTYDRDFALGLLSSRQDSLYQIEQAIDRIRNGTYGVCELTGKRIEAERLEAIPWARFSAEAERRLEREGIRKRAGLGERETVVTASSPRAGDRHEEEA